MDSNSHEFLGMHYQVPPVENFKGIVMMMIHMQPEFRQFARDAQSYCLDAPNSMPGGGLVRDEFEYDDMQPTAFAMQVIVERPDTL